MLDRCQVRESGSSARPAELVEQDDGGAPNMSELARAVGISRQALYLHFPDRGLAAAGAGRATSTNAKTCKPGSPPSQAAPDAAGQIRAWARDAGVAQPADRAPGPRPRPGAPHATRPPQQHGGTAPTTGCAAPPRSSPGCARKAGSTRAGRPAEAATLLWELTSFRVWDNLVQRVRADPRPLRRDRHRGRPRRPPEPDRQAMRV